jgi:hypothetical protein
MLLTVVWTSIQSPWASKCGRSPKVVWGADVAYSLSRPSPNWSAPCSSRSICLGNGKPSEKADNRNWPEMDALSKLKVGVLPGTGKQQARLSPELW